MIRMSRKKQVKNCVFTETQNIPSWQGPTRVIKLQLLALHRTAPKNHTISFSKISERDLSLWKLQFKTKFLSSEKQTNKKISDFAELKIGVSKQTVRY